MANKPLFYDFSVPRADGTDNITLTIKNLLNTYPKLEPTDEVEFQTLDSTSGKAFFPTNSVAIMNEEEDITEHVKQECVYNFLFLYRTSGLNEKRKQTVKEWLDTLGRWLERQTIDVDGEPVTLESYPALSDGKEFKYFKRQSQAYLYATNENKVEDWGISLQAMYINEFDR